jgi:hypothetical protein
MTLEPAPDIESVSPTLNLGAVTSARSTWLGPAWAAACGLIASAAFSFDGPNLLTAAFLFVLIDWAWPAIWTTAVRTDWLAPFARWRETPVPSELERIHLPYLQPGSPGDRMLRQVSRFGTWWRTALAPMAGASLTSGLVATLIAGVLSMAIGWRALALTLAVLALSALGTLRALRAGVDSDGLRSIVYGTLPWWLGHATFAPLGAESAALGVLFGLAYRALMESGERAPSPFSLFAPQSAVAVALFAGHQPAAAFIASLSIAAQIALRAFLVDDAYVRRAQVWLMVVMLAGALAVA